MTAYYNEFDKKAAAWLRGLIKGGHIAYGDVDERSIVDVQPEDIKGYTQVHLFAGIGGWSYALRLAGWSDHRQVWTGSCPCQPFSVAGKGGGVNDSRHLWPHMQRLIKECRPPTIFGEQVASKSGREWLNGVRLEMEALGYGVGAADLCAASVGAPHIRQRLWFVADSKCGATERHGHQMARAKGENQGQEEKRERFRHDTGHGCKSGELANPNMRGRQQEQNTKSTGVQQEGYVDAKLRVESGEHGTGDGDRDVGNPQGRHGRISDEQREEDTQYGWTGETGSVGNTLANTNESICQAGNDKTRREARTDISWRCEKSAVDNFWQPFELVHCTDGKARRIEPGTFPLANGIPARMGRLRGYGNAIVPQVAQAFITAFMEIQIMSGD